MRAEEDFAKAAGAKKLFMEDVLPFGTEVLETLEQCRNCLLLGLGIFQVTPWRFGLGKCDVQHQDGPAHVVPKRCAQAKPFFEALKKLETSPQIESLDTGSDGIVRDFS